MVTVMCYDFDDDFGGDFDDYFDNDFDDDFDDSCENLNPSFLRSHQLWVNLFELVNLQQAQLCKNW